MSPCKVNLLIAKYDERPTKSLVAVGAERKKIRTWIFQKKDYQKFLSKC